jgi:acetyltransferase
VLFRSEQLSYIIAACENDFDNIDAMAVIFGSPGLFPISDVYDLLDKKMRMCSKPIFPILPSVINVKNEINEFLAKGNVNFPDEVIFANALVKVINAPVPEAVDIKRFTIDKDKIRSIINKSSDGYLEPSSIMELLDASLIPRAPEAIALSPEEAIEVSTSLGFPVAMKVIGPVHKSDVGGVTLNIRDKETVSKEHVRMMEITGSKGVLIQKMVSGSELFAGAKAEGAFGHLILAGLGGIFIEVLKDVSSDLVPVSESSARRMIHSLKSYDIIKGTRGKPGINESSFVEIICRLSALIEAAPEIIEMDLNPLMGTKDSIVVVDTRIKVEKGKEI